MHPTTNTRSTPHARSASVLTLALLQMGYLHGAPTHLSKDTLAIDSRIAGQFRCPGCNKRGMTFHPYHRGRQYAALACCEACGAAEEM